MNDKDCLEELKNIVEHSPLFVGNTISRSDVNECVLRGWAERDNDGNFIPTVKGLLKYHLVFKKEKFDE